MLADDFSGLELADLLLGLRIFAHVIVKSFEDASAALRTFAKRFLAGEVQLRSRFLGLAVLRGAFASGFRRARLELEADLAVLAERKERLEGAPVLLRDELRQQIRLAGREQLDHLRAFERLLENDRARAEVAGLGPAHRLLAHVGHPVLVDVRLALGALADGFLAREIHHNGSALGIDVLVAEVELRLELRRKFHDGSERKTLLAAEALKRPDLLLQKQFVDLMRFVEPARRALPQGEVAARIGALKLAIVLFDDAAALRARRFEFPEIAGHSVALEALRALDDVARHLSDLAHEILALHLAARHETQLVLPAAGQLRLAQLRDVEAAQQRDERERLCGRLQFAAQAMDVFLVDQTFDDGGAGRGRAETFLLHRGAQFLVLDRFARAFHRAEQGGFREARRWLGLVLVDVDLRRLDGFVCLDGRKVRRVAALDFAAVHRHPAGLHHHLAFALERLALDARDARGDEEFRRRIEDGEEAFCDEVVKLLLRLAQVFGRERGRDDGVVVRDFRVVEDALVARLDPVVAQNFVSKRPVARPLQGGQRLLDRGAVIFRERARISTGIGEHLVLFVERLGEAERVLRRETKPSIRFALQGGQVIQCAGERAGRLAFLGDDAGLADAFVADGFGPGDFPKALGLQLGVRVFLILVLILGKRFVEPASGIFAALGLERPDDFPVSPRDELLNLLLALDENRERRRLDAAHGRELEAAELRVEGGHRPRAVDADQPVGLGTADGGISKRTDIRIGAQVRKAIADGGRRHGLQPETGDGLLGLGVLDDVAENEFTLAPGVAGIHERIDIFALDEFGEDFEPALGLLDGPQVEVRRDHGQGGEGPLTLLHLELFRDTQLQQMTHGRGENELVALEILVVFLEAPERLGDVAGDGRLFSND